MSSTINNLPNSGSDELDEDVGNILNNLQNDYEQNNINDNINDNENNYNQELNNYNQELNFNNETNTNFENTDSTESPSFINNLINKCKQPLIVLIVVLVINNNFTYSLFKTIPQLNTDGVLNIIGYGVIALMIAIAYFALNIVSNQIL
jgi:hypothetical protein